MPGVVSVKREPMPLSHSPEASHQAKASCQAKRVGIRHANDQTVMHGSIAQECVGEQLVSNSARIRQLEDTIPDSYRRASNGWKLCRASVTCPLAQDVPTNKRSSGDQITTEQAR